ncbi:hypothetical protein H6F68_27450 [Trichocoleus sp. FACHB-262]|nr:hypothetical protein [Trichocoleus sp. FACHB-262]
MDQPRSLGKDSAGTRPVRSPTAGRSSSQPCKRLPKVVQSRYWTVWAASLQWQWRSAVRVPVARLGMLACHTSSHNFNLGRLFMQKITLRGGATPARAYIR